MIIRPSPSDPVAIDDLVRIRRAEVRLLDELTASARLAIVYQWEPKTARSRGKRKVCCVLVGSAASRITATTTHSGKGCFVIRTRCTANSEHLVFPHTTLCLLGMDAMTMQKSDNFDLCVVLVESRTTDDACRRCRG